MSKIYLVTDGAGTAHLVRAHTSRGAAKHVERKLGQQIHAKVPSQEELLGAAAHTPIEDATATATEETTP